MSDFSFNLQDSEEEYERDGDNKGAVENSLTQIPPWAAKALPSADFDSDASQKGSLELVNPTKGITVECCSPRKSKSNGGRRFRLPRVSNEGGKAQGDNSTPTKSPPSKKKWGEEVRRFRLPRVSTGEENIGGNDFTGDKDSTSEEEFNE